MTELIKVKNTSYSRYEELLIKRDQYEREAESILISYTKEFGELTAEIFEAKIECIRLKKMISYCQIFLNRGENIDTDEIEARLQTEMTMYNMELENMLKKNQAARDSKAVSIIDVERTKKVYRRLAKKLHPDINPKTAVIPELSDLWNRIVIAYKELNPREISELEVLANKVIEELGLGTIEVNIPDIEERIVMLEEEIGEILSTEPYIFKHILEDPEEMKKVREQMGNNLKETNDYRASLEAVLQELIEKGGATFTWRMK